MLNSVWATAKLLEISELAQFNGQFGGLLPQSDRAHNRKTGVFTIDTI
jgi:hypothetical protein